MLEQVAVRAEGEAQLVASGAALAVRAAIQALAVMALIVQAQQPQALVVAEAAQNTTVAAVGLGFMGKAQTAPLARIAPLTVAAVLAAKMEMQAWQPQEITVEVVVMVAAEPTLAPGLLGRCALSGVYPVFAAHRLSPLQT